MAKISLHLDSESRADLALLNALKLLGTEVSRAKLKDYFKLGSILFKNKKLDASHIFSKGQYEITYPDDLLEKEVAFASKDGCFLDILYEDENLLILNKTSGIPTLPLTPGETETAVGSALAQAPSIAKVGNAGLEPGLLHRLDTGTSGALAFAKTHSEFTRLKTLWTTGGVVKTYRAWVASESETQLFKIIQTFKLKLGHDPKSSKKMIVVSSDNTKIRGKPLPTETEFVSILNRVDKYFEIEILIRTGVMHQIRCTLQHLGWPILGDKIYKGQEFPRLMLHAWKLKVPLVNGRNLEIIAPTDSSWTLTSR
jgi:23S rRNA pseudouridine1911/1915/1917 synthase